MLPQAGHSMKCDSFERFVDYHNLLQSHVTCKAVLEFPSLSFESRISMSSAKSSAGVGRQYRRAYDFSRIALLLKSSAVCVGGINLTK